MREVIDIKIGSQSDDLIGLPIYFAFFDEVSFQRNQDVEKQKEILLYYPCHKEYVRDKPFDRTATCRSKVLKLE